MDIIVGGAGDRIFGCARRYADDFSSRYPDRHVIYLTQGQRRALQKLMLKAAPDQPVNLIGHSWGAADVAWAVEKNGASNLATVIGVDPVGKPGLWFKECADCDAQVVTTWARGSEGRLMDGNLMAQIGRAIGQTCPSIFAAQDIVSIETPFAHYDMTRMMQHVGTTGVSAEEILLGDFP